MKYHIALLGCIFATASQADFITARSILTPGHIIREQDITTETGTFLGAIERAPHAIGKEVRTTLYPGRPILENSIKNSTLVNRNQIIPIHFKNGNLLIKTEARSLGQAGAGETIRVLNISSNKIITVEIGHDGIGYAQN